MTLENKPSISPVGGMLAPRTPLQNPGANLEASAAGHGKKADLKAVPSLQFKETGVLLIKGNRPPPRHPTGEDIARRAYEIFRTRGESHGHDREDWAQAERELCERKSSQVQGG